MKCYLLAMATLVAVCVGCHSAGALSACEPGGFDGECRNDGRGARDGIRQASHHEYVAPPAEQLLRPGPMVDGPGPGVLQMMGQPMPRPFASVTTEFHFVGPDGMVIGWQIPGGWADAQIVAPGRYSFAQGYTYRLKISNMPGHDGRSLFPSLQVYPAHPETDAYLAHSDVPVQITDEDLDQIEANNFLTKVIYLPSPRHQELAIAGVETLVSTRLDPGIDPVAEAERRGTILAVIRVGNKDMTNVAAMGPQYAANGEEIKQDIRLVDGEQGQRVAPLPIGPAPENPKAVPPPMMMGAPRGYGQSAYSPNGTGPSPSWGMPRTGTPIGLPGPPHLPYGGAASLQSHTVRNKTRMNIPPPTKNMLIDVKHRPGISLPAPVNHIEYEERHPLPVNIDDCKD